MVALAATLKITTFRKKKKKKKKKEKTEKMASFEKLKLVFIIMLWNRNFIPKHFQIFRFFILVNYIMKQFPRMTKC